MSRGEHVNYFTPMSHRCNYDFNSLVHVVNILKNFCLPGPYINDLHLDSDKAFFYTLD